MAGSTYRVLIGSENPKANVGNRLDAHMKNRAEREGGHYAISVFHKDARIMLVDELGLVILQEISGSWTPNTYPPDHRKYAVMGTTRELGLTQAYRYLLARTLARPEQLLIPGMHVDHVNGRRFDNQFLNLRLVRAEENFATRRDASSSRFGQIAWGITEYRMACVPWFRIGPHATNLGWCSTREEAEDLALCVVERARVRRDSRPLSR
jgi:hypothetical protein